MDRIKEEKNEYKSRLEQKEKDQLKSDSKIKALEKIINTNSYNTPIQVSNKENSKPTASGNSNNLNTGGSSSSTCGGRESYKLSNFQNETPVGSSLRPSRGNGAPISQSISRNLAIANHLNSNTVTAKLTTTITKDAYSAHRFQSPIRSKQTVSQIQQQLQQQAQQSAAVREGIPVANRRHARRSKSAEMWLDHKPAATAKLGM